MTLDKYKKDIEEFFYYTDLLSTLRDYYNAYQHYFETHNNMDLQKIKEQIGQTKNLIDQLILVQMIAYITLGSFCENDHVSNSDQKFIINNELINKDLSGWINLFLKLFLNDIHKSGSTVVNNHNDDRRLYEKLIDTYLIIIYLLIITSQSLEKKLVLNEDIPVQLLSILTIKDISLYINKKFYLLIYRVLIIYFGDMDQIKVIKDQIRSFYSLPPIDHDKSFKSTPNDLYDFQCEIKDKYTDYQLPNNSLNTTAALISKMESLSLYEHNNVIIRSPPPFQYYFPPKLKSPPTSSSSSSTTTSTTTRNNVKDDSSSVIEFKKQLEKEQSKTPFVLGTPKAIEEAGQLYISCMDLSISQYQIIQEREKWIKNQDTKIMKQYEHPILHKVESFYNSVVQNLPNVVITLLEQLVVMAPTPSSPILDSMSWSDNNSNEYIDTIRNRQIIRTTISSILLLLLKWFKTSHVMKFEYLSQLLVDCGYLMLSIRSFMIEDIKTINESNFDNQKFGFFSQVNQMNFNHEEGAFSLSTCSSSSSFSIPYSWEDPEQEKDDVDSLPCNQRNKDWILNTLRILQMVTKGKPLRNRTLANYKAFIPLKRITKYNKNSIEELYALKVLKSQVRYLGNEWREDNMKTISAISRRCSMNLRDDWLSLCENDNDDDDNKNTDNHNELKLEDNMRMLVKLYHEEQYNINTLITVGQNYDCNGIDDNDDTTYRCWDNGATNELVQQINHLFKQPLERRFGSKGVIQVPFETDGWDAPTPTTTGVSYLSKKKNNDEYEDDDDIDTDDEEENENMIMNGKNKKDPLENIDWTNLTEDELNARMNLVAEQTEQRWLNIDLNDPAYCKVLLDVETEIDEEIIATNDTFDDDINVDPWSS